MRSISPGRQVLSKNGGSGSRDARIWNQPFVGSVWSQLPAGTPAGRCGAQWIVIEPSGSGVATRTLMLIPLVVGLLARSTWPDDAARWQPILNNLSSMAMLVLLVTGLGTAQSNVSAALVVAAQDFGGTETLPFVLIGSIVLLLVLPPTAKVMGNRVAT